MTNASYARAWRHRKHLDLLFSVRHRAPSSSAGTPQNSPMCVHTIKNQARFKNPWSLNNDEAKSRFKAEERHAAVHAWDEPKPTHLSTAAALSFGTIRKVAGNENKNPHTGGAIDSIF